jgi:hypothetical protein
MDAGIHIGNGDGGVGNRRSGGVVNGANQAAILILRSCVYATNCNQEACQKEKSEENT